MNQKRKFTPLRSKRWQKEDSDPEDDFDGFEEEEEVTDVEDLLVLLKELLLECRKLNTTLSLPPLTRT